MADGLPQNTAIPSIGQKMPAPVTPGPQHNEVAFDKAVSETAWQMRWRKGTRCPCVDRNAMSADTSCTVCAGIGWIWDAVSGPWLLQLTGVLPRHEYTLFGDWQAGDAMVTIPYRFRDFSRAGFPSVLIPAYNAMVPDRFILIDTQRILQTQRPLKRGTEDVLPGPQDPQAMDRVFRINDAKTAVIDFVEGTDYNLNGRTIEWVSGTVPPVGTQYVARWLVNLEYFVYRDVTRFRRHQAGEWFPRELHLRPLDLFANARF